MQPRPEPGFYYHYKHNPEESVNNYAYRVFGVTWFTEECDPEIKYMVAYRPIYADANVYKDGKINYARPLSMFMDEVTKDGKTFPRFSKITDPEIIEKLKEIEKELYK